MYRAIVGQIEKILRGGLVALVQLYRYCISPFLGQHCRFYPSCSTYALQAIKTHGSIKGLWLTLKRLLKCHPGHPGGLDPVPESNK